MILPPDQHAGAAAAGVVQLMDRKLVGYHRGFQGMYRQGLVALGARFQGFRAAVLPAQRRGYRCQPGDPRFESRVEVDSKVRDFWGIRVARLSGTDRPHNLKLSQLAADKAELWLREAGAKRVLRRQKTANSLSAAQHQAGTCRMGGDQLPQHPQGALRGLPQERCAGTPESTVLAGDVLVCGSRQGASERTRDCSSAPRR